MKTQTQFLIIFLVYFLATFSTDAQNAEQTVREAVTKINNKIGELHNMAAQKYIYTAINKLDEINKDINKEIMWGTFDQTFKEAKMANPNFDFNISGDLPQQLDTQFWTNYEARCDRIMANQKKSQEGIEAMLKLNRLDEAMAYGAQIKTAYETFESAAENLGTANLPKFAYDLYGNMNDFIENYKKIEKAYSDGIDIQVFETEINRMSSRARHSQNQYNDYKRFIQSNIIVITDFKANIEYINMLKDEATSGPLAKLSYSNNKYNWDYGPFQTNVEVACDEFGIYEISCVDFRSNYSAITTNARKDWYIIESNIKASDDIEKKAEFLKYHDDRWVEFLGVADAIFNSTYQKSCGKNASEKTNATDNTGATDGKFTICNLKVDNKISDFGGGKRFVKLTFGLTHKGGNFFTIFNMVFDGKQITQNTRSKAQFPGYQSVDDMEFAFALPDNVNGGQHTIKLVVKVDSETISTTETIKISGSSVTKVTNNTKNIESSTEPLEVFDFNNNNDDTMNQTQKTHTSEDNNNHTKNQNNYDPEPIYHNPKNSTKQKTSMYSGDFLSGNGWSVQKIQNSTESLQNNINNATNNGKTPAGIYVNEKEVIIYYINDNPLGMTSWNLEWYTDAESLQTGITNNLEQGYFPMGVSFTNSGSLYVLYIMSQLSTTAWQLVESELELNSVANDVQPWINENYVPVGITVFGGMYYTLLAQLPDAHVSNWTIEGYENNSHIIEQNVNGNINSGLIPFGYLQEEGVVNILYVGF